MSKEDIFERGRKRANELWSKTSIRNIDAAFTSLLLEATEDLIEKIEKLNKQNQKLEETNIALQKAALILGFIASFAVFYQFLRDWLNLHPICNFFIALGFTLLLAALLAKWLRRN